MFLSAGNIKQLITDLSTPLINPADPTQLKHMEGSAYDLRLGAVYALDKNTTAFVGKEKRTTPPAIRRAPNGGLWLLTQGIYLLQSIEELSVPDNLCALFESRSTLFRCGADLKVTSAKPGWFGKVIGRLQVPEGFSITFERGARFCSVKFADFSSYETDPYDGIYTGDKVGTNGKMERGY